MLAHDLRTISSPLDIGTPWRRPRTELQLCGRLNSLASRANCSQRSAWERKRSVSVIEYALSPDAVGCVVIDNTCNFTWFPKQGGHATIRNVSR